MFRVRTPALQLWFGCSVRSVVQCSLAASDQLNKYSFTMSIAGLSSSSICTLPKALLRALGLCLPAPRVAQPKFLKIRIWNMLIIVVYSIETQNYLGNLVISIHNASIIIRASSPYHCSNVTLAGGITESSTCSMVER